ncbi:MAG: dTMP kinase [Actinomycetota bacterium]|nr:dTMP kinase [Actinomycetota bacterium]
MSFWSLIKSNANFRRFFAAQFVSSLGDWTGVIAIAVFAQALGGPAAVGIVMTARVLPGFVAGPIAGVLADRWDRKRTMVIADLSRGLIVFSLPFVPNLIYLLIASMVLECLTLMWGPAKDASLPNFVSAEELTHANSLSLIAAYGPWPLASVIFAGMATLNGVLADHVSVLSGLQNSQVALSLWVDALTFGFSALMISSLTIPSSRRRGRLDFAQAKEDLFEGLRFIRDHGQVRPWLIGIGLTFTAAGAVFSLGIAFVDVVLGGGSRGFAFLVGFLATGMIIGLLASGALAKRVRKDVLFSSSLLLLGAGLVALASVGNLDAAIPIASALGFFGGSAYSMGYSLIQESVSDEIRGRTFSAAYTVIRIGTLAGLGIFPLLAGAIGDHTLHLAFATILLPGSRITLWLAGAVAAAGGVLSMRAISAAPGPRPVARATSQGFFVVFEGGEGAGKSTQMAAFARYLSARGDEVITTREPGGTVIGERIRSLLLDPGLTEMDARTEALLYAADRAQHVAQIIKPALEAGKIVVSDRFVDSSLAYQGLARGLGLEDIFEISDWATEGLVPDIVFFMKLDPATRMDRVGHERDRIEGEADDFHMRVEDAYEEIAKRFPDRFVVLDASGTAGQVHADVVRAFEERTKDEKVTIGQATRPLAPPVPR